MRYIITGDDGREYWTGEQCAAHCGVALRSFLSYVSRDQAPASVGHLNARTPLWDSEEVRTWHAARPSQRTKPR